MTDQAQRERRDDPRHGTRTAPPAGGMQGLHLRVAVLPAVAVAVLGIGTAAFLLTSGRSVMTTRIVLVGAAVLTVLALIAAVGGAASATRRLQRQVAGLRSASARAQDEMRTLAERAQRGDQPALTPPPAAEEGGDSLALLAGDLQRERFAAGQILLASATRGQAAGPDQRVEVFVNLARRMQSLVHREIQLLDDLEGQVEDPVLLKGLFTVDHLATRMRRQSESLAVLGGAVSRRQWSRPVTMHEVLRAAVAEVEQYSRVKVVPPVEGTLMGSAVTDVIHLVAELIENATKFSAPHTHAMLRAQAVTAGLVIEVEDRGLGMLPADQQRMNGLLADPSRVNIGELLRDGRIGLFVVATLARRHGIRVQLQTNIYGGIQAVVVLPKNLIEPAPDREAQAPAAASRAAAPRPVATSHPAPAPRPVATSRPAPAPRPVAASRPGAGRPADSGSGLPVREVPGRQAPATDVSVPQQQPQYAEARVPQPVPAAASDPATADPDSLQARPTPAGPASPGGPPASMTPPAGLSGTGPSGTGPSAVASPAADSTAPANSHPANSHPADSQPADSFAAGSAPADSHAAGPYPADPPGPLSSSGPLSGPGARNAPGTGRSPWPGMAAEGRYAPAGRPASPAGYTAPPTGPQPASTGQLHGGPVPPARPSVFTPSSATATPFPPGATPPGGLPPPSGLPSDGFPPGGFPSAGPPAAPATGERPALPRRRGQSHIAPELREARAPRRDEPVDDQIPGLMAAFQRGISRAADEQPGPD